MIPANPRPRIRLFLAACVIALAGCATTAQNGPLATEANVIASLEAAAELGNALYTANKIPDDQADLLISLFRSAKASVAAAAAADAAGDKAHASAYLRAAADALDDLMARLAAIKAKG